MALSVIAAGVDTWSPCWYLREGSAAERAIESLANVRAKRGRVMSESIQGHRIGWFASERMLYAEGHPGGENLGCPDDLPQVLEELAGGIVDYGIPLPDGLTLDPWLVDERRPGFAGVRRVDATCDLAFDVGGEGMAVLAGVAAMDLPRVQRAIRYQPGGTAVETVAYHGHGGRKMLARWYDKSVESGCGPRGTLVRPEDQRRYELMSRRSAEELTSSYVRGSFQRRFVPLWQATRGVIVGGPTVLARELVEAVEGGEITYAQAERMAGYLTLDRAGQPRMPARTRRRRRGEARKLGLVLADGVLEEVEVDLHDVLDQVLESEVWGARG
jgi:hypothetical protein